MIFGEWKKFDTLIFFFIVTIFLFFIYFSILINHNIGTDIQGHIHIIKNNYISIVTPLYYKTIYIFSGFSNQCESLLRSAIFILSMCMGLKFLISTKILESIAHTDKKEHYIISFLCLFLAPIPINNYLYLNTFPITVVHNSTSIMAIIFALLIFYQTIKFFENQSNRSLIAITLLSIITCLIKPNFMFAYIPSLPCLCLINRSQNRNFYKALTLSIILFSIILIQTFVYSSHDGKINIDFLFIHNLYSVGLITDVIKYVLSIAFPLSILLFSNSECIKKDHLLQFSWLLLFFSVCIAFLFVEDNVRKIDGNFYWQVHMSNFILFLVSTKYLNLNVAHSKRKVKDLLLWLVFIAHNISGVKYLTEVITRGSYA